MPEGEGGLKKTLGIIAVILTIIGGIITVYEKWGVVTIIVSGCISWVWKGLLWIWNLKIPFLWVPFAYIIYKIGNAVLFPPNNDENVSSPDIVLRNMLSKDIERKIVGFCVEPMRSDQILKEVKEVYYRVESVDYYLTRLEEVDAIIFNPDDGTWKSTPKALEIVLKYHGAF